MHTEQHKTPLEGPWLGLSMAVLICLMGALPALGAPNSKEHAVPQTVEFRSDRVYEVTGIWVDPANMPALGAYFQKVFPIAASKYGVRPLFSLEPQGAHAGDFLPQMMFVNEWPSIESFQAFTSDPDAVALFPQRDAVVERLVVSHYQVPETVSVDLQDGDVLEFAAMWVRPGQEDALKSYYQKAVQIALQNGLQPVSPLQVVDSYKGDFRPHRAGLNLWRTMDNFKAFEYQARDLFPNRDAALTRLEVTHAKVRFENAEQ